MTPHGEAYTKKQFLIIKFVIIASCTLKINFVAACTQVYIEILIKYCYSYIRTKREETFEARQS